jgi:hypothetical protein
MRIVAGMRRRWRWRSFPLTGDEETGDRGLMAGEGIFLQQIAHGVSLAPVFSGRARRLSRSPPSQRDVFGAPCLSLPARQGEDGRSQLRKGRSPDGKLLPQAVVEVDDAVAEAALVQQLEVQARARRQNARAAADGDR